MPNASSLKTGLIIDSSMKGWDSSPNCPVFMYMRRFLTLTGMAAGTLAMGAHVVYDHNWRSICRSIEIS